MKERMERQLEFALEIDKVKNIFRQTHLSGYVRNENDAEGLKTQKSREDAAKERIFSILPEEQKKEFIALFDEFEAYETPESKFAHAMDNLQPLLLNNSNGGRDWREHEVSAKQVYGRQGKTKLGSTELFEVVDQIIQENIKKGNIIYYILYIGKY